MRLVRVCIASMSVNRPKWNRKYFTLCFQSHLVKSIPTVNFVPKTRFQTRHPFATLNSS